MKIMYLVMAIWFLIEGTIYLSGSAVISKGDAVLNTYIVAVLAWCCFIKTDEK